MRILVINGSPKGSKSDVIHVTNAFCRGLNYSFEHITTTINLVDFDIKFCKGCLSCIKSDKGKCSIEDDMGFLCKQVIDSDYVIFSFPIYCFGLPALLKAFIDRTMPIFICAYRGKTEFDFFLQSRLQQQKYISISGSGFSNDIKAFIPVDLMLKQYLGASLKLAIRIRQSPVFSDKAANHITTSFLNNIENAGKQFMKFGFIDDGLLDKINSLVFPPVFYKEMALKKGINCVI